MRSKFNELKYYKDDHGHNHNFAIDMEVDGRRLRQGIRCGNTAEDVAHGLKALGAWMLSQNPESLSMFDVLKAENRELQYQLSLANQALAAIKQEREDEKAWSSGLNKAMEDVIMGYRIERG